MAGGTGFFDFDYSVGTSIEEQAGERTIQFGEGFEQSEPSDPRNIARRFRVRMNRKPTVDVEAAREFLRGQRSVPFYFTDHDRGEVVTVKCLRWRTTYSSHSRSTLTAEFVEVRA